MSEADGRDEHEVATVNRPPKTQVKAEGNHFQKLMDTSCQNHGYPVHHKLGECDILKRYINNPPSKKAKPEEITQVSEQNTTTEDFPKPMGCLMIFGDPEAFDDKRRINMACREMHVVDPVVPK